MLRLQSLETPFQLLYHMVSLLYFLKKAISFFFDHEDALVSFFLVASEGHYLLFEILDKLGLCCELCLQPLVCFLFFNQFEVYLLSQLFFKPVLHNKRAHRFVKGSRCLFRLLRHIFSFSLLFQTSIFVVKA